MTQREYVKPFWMAGLALAAIVVWLIPVLLALAALLK